MALDRPCNGRLLNGRGEYVGSKTPGFGISGSG